jgi:hypothetical protein
MKNYGWWAKVLLRYFFNQNSVASFIVVGTSHLIHTHNPLVLSLKECYTSSMNLMPWPADENMQGLPICKKNN